MSTVTSSQVIYESCLSVQTLDKPKEYELKLKSIEFHQKRNLNLSVS